MDPELGVSVVIPARDAEATLAAAIESALAQSPPPLEVIVVDDESKDATAAVARGFGPRVRLLAGSGRGPAAARNIGVRASSGGSVAFLDADDIWLPAALATLREGYRAQPRAGLVFGDVVIEGDGSGPASWFARKRLVESGEVYDRLLRECFILTSATLAPRAALDEAARGEAGLFDESPDCYSGEDWDLWLRIARRRPLAAVRTPVVRRRILGGNLTKSALRVARARVYVLRKHALLDACDPMAERGTIERELARWLGGLGYEQFRHRQFAAARESIREARRLAPVRRRQRAMEIVASLPGPVARAASALAGVARPRRGGP